MTRTLPILALLALLAACGDGQPLFKQDTLAGADQGDGSQADDNSGDDAAGDDPDAVVDPAELLATNTVAPPLLETLAARGDITRSEAPDTAHSVATLFKYNGTDDTFSVDGIAFDGLNTYERFSALPNLGGVAIYQAESVVKDALTEDPVNQIIPYFALYDASGKALDDGTSRTSFAIVRTGGYVGYGFGSYAYQRAGGVTLQETGQATFSGRYAGTRIFDGLNNIELAEADVTIDFDFNDFNVGKGIKGRLTNRQYYNSNGEALETFSSTERGSKPIDAIQAPDLRFVVRANAQNIADNGEIAGEVLNWVDNSGTGTLVEYEKGNYYGIIAGDLTDTDDGGEVVGVLVFEVPDSRYSSITAQETGGFIATRK